MLSSMRSAGRPKFKYASANSFVYFHGNSLVEQMPMATLSAMAPISGTSTVFNWGQSGRTLNDMVGSTSVSSNEDTIYASYPGRKRILIAWEGTNSIANGKTGAEAAALWQQYCYNRLFHNPWHIILMTTLPMRFGSKTDAEVLANNQQVDICNQLMRDNYRSWGAKQLIDVRPEGGPFDLSGYAQADFEAISSYFSDAYPQRVHLTTTGYNYVLAQIAAELNRVTK